MSRISNHTLRLFLLLAILPNPARSQDPDPRREHSLQRTTPRDNLLTIQWLGQDAHDYVSPNNRREPSDVQDIHLQLTGVDPDREIAFIDLTGQGGDQWQYNAQSFAWKMEVKRIRKSASADLFVEPGRHETRRQFHLIVRYTDGFTLDTHFRGGTADPYLRMPGAAIAATWIGQDGEDWTGLTPSVGPDGLQDARLYLEGLSNKVNIKGIRLQLPQTRRWEFGTNPKAYPSAELRRDPDNPARAELFFQPDQDLNDQPLELIVLYDNEKLDKTTLKAGPTKPRQPTASSELPAFKDLPETTLTWIGQDALDPNHPGDLHLRVNHLPTNLTLAAATLNNPDDSFWVHKANSTVQVATDFATKPLHYRPGADPTTADLLFEPNRNSRDETFTLRLLFTDGTSSLLRVTGQPCDLSKKSRQPAPTVAIAKPRDNLQDLVDHHGTVRLSTGTYTLNKPLILNHPVTLTADPGATLRFSQPASEPEWTTAIKIHSSNTTLENFAVRFDTPIRWQNGISYGPAVIGTTDQLDRGYDNIKHNIRLLHLDLEAPPVPPEPAWTEAVRLMRLVHTENGTISGNTLRGGPIECFEGPWIFENNTYNGCLPGTFSHGVVTWHDPRDVTVRDNRARDQGPSGKTWRFLVFTGHGQNALVENNQIEHLGSHPDDTIPWSNEPEIILTESYHLKYEGILITQSLGGRLIRIAPPQAPPIRTGDVVSLLNGPAAGRYRRILQAIDSTTFLIDEPIPAGTSTISISSGFVGHVYRDNRIDIRRSRRSNPMVLAGNHFGTRILHNHLIGGDIGLSAHACATESPIAWGWSHCPFLGVTIKDNIFEDSETGAVIGVEHSPFTKSSTGRTYQSVKLHNNTIRWTDPFLANRRRKNKKGHPTALTLGFLPSLDPNELTVDSEHNTLEAASLSRPVASLWIRAANFNFRPIVDRRFSLPSSTTERNHK